MQAKRLIHVSIEGDDLNHGTEAAPLRNIATAAQRAQPGDIVRVHAGIYRESINPARGGLSDSERIIYEAAPGELVEIRGSEPVTDWELVEKGLWSIWKAEMDNQIFGDFNPFASPIRGDWFLCLGRPHSRGAVYLNGKALHEATSPEHLQRTFWAARVGATSTTIWISCREENPNLCLVEVNVRPTIFYPEKTGINFITVRGFTMRHAATNWAPPTAEQIGLIGTNWSKGWIIEDCIITDSRCVGVTLGKYGDEHDNTSDSSATGHLASIQRAVERGWNRIIVGGHIVRNNHIANCEQAGIVGSLGAIFSEITGNKIHDIHVHHLFNGAEQAGIKLHGPVDSLIANNHIYRTIRAIWLDWQAQGTRISRNVCHDNQEHDLFVEVNHGPFVVDHNFFLSPVSIFSVSQGGTFAHNLLAGKLSRVPELGRETPWMPEHSTEIAGIARIDGGDERYLNNLMLLPSALRAAEGKVDFIAGAKDKAEELAHVCFPNISEANQILSGAPEIEEREDGFYLIMETDAVKWEPVRLVTTESLGITKVSGLPFKDYDGSTLSLDTDFFGIPFERGDELVAGPVRRSGLAIKALKVFGKKTQVAASEKIMIV